MTCVQTSPLNYDENKKSHWLSTFLRHTGGRRGYRYRQDGYFGIADVCRAFNEDRRARMIKSSEMLGGDLVRIVRLSDKARFTIWLEQGRPGWIRANQGHSLRNIEDSQVFERACR